MGAATVSPRAEGEGGADMTSISRRRCSRVFSWSRYDVPIAINHPLAEQRAESREANGHICEQKQAQIGDLVSKISFRAKEMHR